MVLQTNFLKDCRLEKLLGALREQTKFHNLVIRLKLGSLKSTGSAKRSFKIERIKLPLSGTYGHEK